MFISVLTIFFLMRYFITYLPLNKIKIVLPLVFIVFFIQWAYAEPYVIDENYVVENYISGLNFPTSFLFVENDILVLEKAGKIRLVRGGVLEPNPVLHLKIDNRGEGGLLGITQNDSSVYVYYTIKLDEKGEILVNQISKYQWNGTNLIDGKIVKQLPAGLKTHEHNGGAMATGLDGMVYAVIGDAEKRGISQNIPDGKIYDTGVVIKVNFDESVIEPSKSENPFEHYQAIGIRNSFGLAVDPLTGNLWDTENGHVVFDEINLLNSKFNSGWTKIMGPSNEPEKMPKIHNFVYKDPKFSWESTVAPTALTFVNSDEFRDYADFLFVGDFNTGTIYQFKLNNERDGFIFENSELKDLVLNHEDMVNDIVFSTGFKGITDLDFGPDGSLYVLSPFAGSIYRIQSQTTDSNNQSEGIFNLFEAIFLLFTSFFHGNIDTSECDKVIEPRIDLSNCNLEDRNLSFSDLKLSKFRKSILSDINFTESDLRSVTFDESNISKSDFSKTSLRFASFRNATLEKVNFEKSSMDYVHFENAQVTNSNFAQVSFQKSNLKDSTLTNSDFSKTKFQYTSLVNANLKNAYGPGANFYVANLSNADLSNSNFTSAIFNYIRAKNVNLENSDLSNSSFFVSRLWGANLSNSEFKNSDFSKSILVKANLSKSNFQGANFSGSNLSGANLSGANFLNANLDHANLEGANLSSANLSGAKINGTNFIDAITEGCISCPKISDP